MLYRRFPGCRKRRSAHTTFHDRCQGAQRVAGHPRVWRRSAPAGCPACRGRDDASCVVVPKDQSSFSNVIRINRTGLVHSVRRRNQPVVRGRRKGVCSGPCPSIARSVGRWMDAVPHGPRAVHLHPARIPENSVLPRAESATGCIFRQPGCRAGAITYPRQVFPKHSPKCAETTVAGRGTAKRIG